MKHFLSFASILFLLFSCGPIQRVDTTAMKEEMNNFEIKRLTSAQINAQVEALGEKIAKGLTSAAEQALAQNEKTEDICQLINIKIIDSLSRIYKTKIRLIGKADIANKSLYGKEKEVLAAYQYNAESKLPMSSNVQKINDTLYVYTAPISAQSKICEACFKTDANKLAIWSIIISKTEVIRKIDMKKL